MNNHFSDIEQRVNRYWYMDGLGELVGGGGMCLILAVYFAAQQYFEEDSLVSGLLQAGLVLVLLGSLALVRWLINIAKSRVTFPRTGYVEYRSSRVNGILSAVLSAAAGIVMAVTIVFIVRQLNRIDAMVAVSGAVMGIILLVKQVRTARVKRFYILSVSSLIFGALLSVSRFPSGYNLGLFYGLMSISFVISGGLTLKKYLSENRLPIERYHEG